MNFTWKRIVIITFVPSIDKEGIFPHRTVQKAG